MEKCSQCVNLFDTINCGQCPQFSSGWAKIQSLQERLWRTSNKTMVYRNCLLGRLLFMIRSKTEATIISFGLATRVGQTRSGFTPLPGTELKISIPNILLSCFQSNKKLPSTHVKMAWLNFLSKDKHLCTFVQSYNSFIFNNTQAVQKHR